MLEVGQKYSVRTLLLHNEESNGAVLGDSMGDELFLFENGKLIPLKAALACGCRFCLDPQTRAWQELTVKRFEESARFKPSDEVIVAAFEQCMRIAEEHKIRMKVTLHGRELPNEVVMAAWSRELKKRTGDKAKSQVLAPIDDPDYA
jgi:hypothetical protein